eukprot:1345624-Amorphochlora_amoeboformis.AAC.3
MACSLRMWLRICGRSTNSGGRNVDESSIICASRSCLRRYLSLSTTFRASAVEIVYVNPL